MTHKIYLSGKRGKNHNTLVDEETFNKYNHLSWYLSDTGYAMHTTKEGHIRLHRLITNAPEGLVVDHLNGNKLDNRISNLRVCSQKDNAQNRKNIKGYCWDKSKNKWIVRYRSKFYGRYNTKEEAIRAYQLACSGVVYNKSKRKYWNLPTNITKQFGKYRVRPQMNGKRIWLGQFSTLEEAQKKLNEWKKEG